MQSIKSGTTTERIVRATLLMVLINGFAVAFLWDGYVGYARQNAEELARSLGMTQEAIPKINPALTAAEAKRLIQDVANAADATSVTDLLGSPAIERGKDAYYLAKGGHLRVRWDQDRAAVAEWIDGVHTETDLAIQRWFGYVLGLLGVIYIIQFVRVVTTRVSLTDQGLKLRGRALIPFAAMRSLRRDRSGRSARVELGYSLGGRDGFVRLDDYVIKKLSAIVAAICGQKGFTNPLSLDARDPDAAHAPRSPEQ